jgi:hypothetical protein
MIIAPATTAAAQISGHVSRMAMTATHPLFFVLCAKRQPARPVRNLRSPSSWFARTNAECSHSGTDWALVRKCTDRKAEHVQAPAMMDEWTEELRCSRCSKIGIASLCQGSDLERPIVGLSVSNGFKVFNDRYGFRFFCETCDAQATERRLSEQALVLLLLENSGDEMKDDDSNPVFGELATLEAKKINWAIAGRVADPGRYF